MPAYYLYSRFDGIDESTDVNREAVGWVEEAFDSFENAREVLKDVYAKGGGAFIVKESSGAQYSERDGWGVWSVDS